MSSIIQRFFSVPVEYERPISFWIQECRYSDDPIFNSQNFPPSMKGTGELAMVLWKPEKQLPAGELVKLASRDGLRHANLHEGLSFLDQHCSDANWGMFFLGALLSKDGNHFIIPHFQRQDARLYAVEVEVGHVWLANNVFLCIE